MTDNFLAPLSLLQRGPRGLTLAIERALWHLGFIDVRVIDGANDHGADVLAVRAGKQWIIQCKWSSRGPIDISGVNDLERARTHYGADATVLATNTSLNRPAEARRKELEGIGMRIHVWNGPTLDQIWRQMDETIPPRFPLRPYQIEAISALEEDLRDTGRALLVLATGLGKTVVGGEVVRRFLNNQPGAQVLVLAHMKDLVNQLEKAFWPHLSKFTSTRTLHGDSPARGFDGVTVATIDSALSALADGYRPDLIMVDETHHVAAEGMFSKFLDTCAEAAQFGVTATPWRGDKYDIAERFGRPSFKLGIAEGMAAGYLSKIDYRMFVDNLNWEVVRSASERGYSIKELNRVLFLPQRDEEIIDEIRNAWHELKSPRAVVFCQTIEHAERIASLLQRSDPAWKNAAYLHSGMHTQRRQILLNAFRIGRVPILTCVDVFNEGVDVPDVNLIAFLRVTHSRRIFVQQLGRGLRLREGKKELKVLDFVTDIRRVAATLDLKRQLEGLHPEVVRLPNHSNISFNDQTAGTLLNYWIEDAASLETTAEEVRLDFPSPTGID